MTEGLSAELSSCEKDLWPISLKCLLPGPLDKKFAELCLTTGFHLWVEKIPWRSERLPTPVFWPGEFHMHIRHVYAIQYMNMNRNFVENSTDCIVHGVVKSRTWLSDFHFQKPGRVVMSEVME